MLIDDGGVEETHEEVGLFEVRRVEGFGVDGGGGEQGGAVLVPEVKGRLGVAREGEDEVEVFDLLAGAG